ncbi:MAG: AraC family transcriptional regulator ligand-binding domain-containing protein [Pseudomonadota bacterium]
MAKARAATLTNYVEVAESVGLDPDAMLARAGLSRALLADPDRQIQGESVSGLLEQSALQSGCMSFGLLMAEARPISGLGAVSLLVKNQRTLRDAIRVLIRYQHVLADTLLINLDESGDSSVIRVDIMSQHHMTRQPIEMTVGEMCLAFTAIAGGKWHPECAHFIHAAPGDLRVHQRIFGCPVQFESEFNGLTCSPASLATPIPGAEPELARYAQNSIALLVPADAEGGVAERVRRALYLLLPAGRGTLEHAGVELGLHPRALQRALVREGTSFGLVLGGVRRELALRHLATPAHSIEAIAVLVGYSTLSSFSRWFGAEFGVPAGVWRTGVRPEAD